MWSAPSRSVFTAPKIKLNRQLAEFSGITGEKTQQIRRNESSVRNHRTVSLLFIDDGVNGNLNKAKIGRAHV